MEKVYNDYLHMIISGWYSLLEWFGSNKIPSTDTIFGVVIGVLLFWMIILIFKSSGKTGRLRFLKGNRAMTSKDQEDLERRVLSDLITDAIEDAVIRGIIPPEAATKWYSRFGNFFKNPDLLTKKSKFLKVMIKERLKKEDFTPVKFPEENKETAEKKLMLRPRVN